MNHQRSFSFFHLISTASAVLAEVFRAGRVAFRLRASLVAENLFLRKQLAFYRERQVKPRRLTDPPRLLLILWSLWFDWKNGLVVVKPESFIGWHRRAFQLLWRWKSHGGRPRLPKHLCALIAEMVRENPTWGEARMASELALKLGIRGIATNRARPLAGRPKSKSWSLLPALDDLCAKPCQGHRGL